MMHWILIDKANTIDWHFAYSIADYFLGNSYVVRDYTTQTFYCTRLSQKLEMT